MASRGRGADPGRDGLAAQVSPGPHSAPQFLRALPLRPVPFPPSRSLQYGALGLALVLGVWLALPHAGPAPSSLPDVLVSPETVETTPGGASPEAPAPAEAAPAEAAPGIPAGGSGHQILAAGAGLAAGSQITSGGPAHRMSEVPGSGVAPGDRVIALTFDDGPDPVYTPQVLRVLAALQVTATFFMIGWEANATPNLVRQVAAAGDGIGSHTWNHVDLTRLGDAGFRTQVDRTNELLGSLTGRHISCVRPPQGHIDHGVVGRLASRGLTGVLSSDDPRDWTRPGTSSIVRQVLAQSSPGAIVELHDGGGDRSETVQALPAIIQGLRAAGYRLAPICV